MVSIVALELFNKRIEYKDAKSCWMLEDDDGVELKMGGPNTLQRAKDDNIKGVLGPPLSTTTRYVDRSYKQAIG